MTLKQADPKVLGSKPKRISVKTFPTIKREEAWRPAHFIGAISSSMDALQLQIDVYNSQGIPDFNNNCELDGSTGWAYDWTTLKMIPNENALDNQYGFVISVEATQK